MTYVATLATFLLLVMWAAHASAHPHVWIDVQLSFRFDTSGRIDALFLHWRFDEDYSAYAVAGLDVDGDGTYTKDELVPLVKDVSESLPEYDYFTAVTAGGEPVAFRPDAVIAAAFDGRSLDLDLLLPLAAPPDPRLAAVEVATYDPTYYVALDLVEQGTVRLDGAVPPRCRTSIEAPRMQGAPWLSDDAASDLQLARQYAMSYAPRATLTCR